MKQTFFALSGGYWEEYKSVFRGQVKDTEWTFDRIQEASEKVSKDEASRRAMRCHLVIFAPALQKFSSGRLRLVGLSWAEAHLLVVCFLWRKT